MASESPTERSLAELNVATNASLSILLLMQNGIVRLVEPGAGGECYLSIEVNFDVFYIQRALQCTTLNHQNAPLNGLPCNVSKWANRIREQNRRTESSLIQ